MAFNNICRFKKNQDNQDFLFRATKSIGIQSRILITYKMSLGIQKYIDFDGFFEMVDFMRFFN
jgi:hypothetical protein